MVDWASTKSSTRSLALNQRRASIRPRYRFAEAVAPLFEEKRNDQAESLKYTDSRIWRVPRWSLAYLKEHPTLGHSPGPTLSSTVLFGLILPTQERAKAISFECKIKFSESGPQPPKSGNAILSLRTAGDGTVRRGEHLYAVRSDAPRVWTWTYHFSDGKQQPSVPSISSLDCESLLDPSARIKQKLAASSMVRSAIDLLSPAAPLEPVLCWKADVVATSSRYPSRRSDPGGVPADLR